MAVLRHLARGIRLRCPNCGEGRIFRRFFEARHECEVCGRAYETTAGDWTGGAEMTLLLALPFAVLLLFGLMAYADLTARQEVAVVMGVVAVVLPLAYRHVKGFWLGLMRTWEGPEPEPPRSMNEPEWFRDFWDEQGR